MPKMNGPRGDADVEVDEANTRLVAGLKSCRTVVENYRAMLSGEPEEGADAAPADQVPGVDPEEGLLPEERRPVIVPANRR